jgi:ureidoacrylate peracid hydrolase
MDVKVLDRSRFVALMKSHLTIDAKKTAIVAVDMNEGQLDPEVAIQLVPEGERRRVLANTRKLIEIARRHRIPIIHCSITRRPIESQRRRNPFSQYARLVNEQLPPEERSWTGKTGQSNYTSGWWRPRIMPEIAPGPDDYLIDNKKTYSVYYGTDLENLLRTLEADTVIMIGINTNTCVQSSCFETVNLGFKLIVISDCVASAYGEDLHRFALENIARCCGWVLTVPELGEKLAAGEARAGNVIPGAAPHGTLATSG